MDYNEMMAEARPIVNAYPRADTAQWNVFNSFFRGGKNIMTPNYVAMLSLDNGNHIVEVAYGTGMSNQYIFGVTVVTKGKDGKYYEDKDLTMLQPSLTALKFYLEELNEEEENDS